MSSSQWISATVREMPRSSSCSIETGGSVFEGLSKPGLPLKAVALLSTAMNLSAKGMRGLVTAGAAGIGRVIAQTFIDNGAGVHVCDVDERALAGLPEKITRTRADVASLQDVQRLFVDVARHLGGLDVLVNNAGIAGPTAKVEDVRPE